MGRAVTLLRSVRPALSARRFFADVPAAVEEQLEGELAVVEDTAVAVARRMEQTGAFARSARASRLPLPLRRLSRGPTSQATSHCELSARRSLRGGARGKWKV